MIHVLRASAVANIDRVRAGPELAAFFQTRAGDSRPPDIVVQLIPGVISTSPTATKIAEHGDGRYIDAHAALDARDRTEPRDRARVYRADCPTILAALGLDPQAFQVGSWNRKVGAKIESYCKNQRQRGGVR